ncbi:hypothetical protein CXF85_14635 [Colwellia sp. 75C3]|uniref:PilW family protein n=1 Tax=Colwellia sp. 75C3 TaxID=888425 RepID=UPI000C34F599|nr:prepilin-type N-terminal cleavage/methylation domain-containing protein [Colwellia sp. 75C3]PKG82132.1 hypothetical protein CXF85_14635 [Colwellia sp. 75C3]
MNQSGKIPLYKRTYSHTCSKGFTLVELMISLALGTIVISGLMSVYVSTVVSSSDTLQMSKLLQQSSALMNMIGSDIRRAGYWGQGDSTISDYIARDPSANPFNESSHSELTLIDSLKSNTVIFGNSAATGECLVFSYDINGDGVLSAQDIVGFRLNAGVAQMRNVGDIASTKHDSCLSGTWEDLTDSEVVNIDKLTFSLEKSVCINTREPDNVDNDSSNGIDDDAEMDCYQQSPKITSGDVTSETVQITVKIESSLTGDPFVKSQLNQVFRVRNDRVRTW